MRDEWGRLLALLVAQYRRLDLAEDGLADAFEAAARTWTEEPRNPAAWLLTAARRRTVDRLRAEAVADRRMPLLAVEAERAEVRVLAATGEPVVDERLRLVLLCADPVLAPEAAAALALRLVLGVPTEDIARLFLVSAPTMAARLTRARKRLAGASLAVPAGPALAARVRSVAGIAYLAFTAGYAPGSGGSVVRTELSAEAVRLVRVLRDVLGTLPRGSYDVVELDALLALVLLQHSRRDARQHEGRVVLLADQDRFRWHHGNIEEALDLLVPWATAAPAPYLLQALNAAEHAVARTAADTRWDRIVQRYDELLALEDSPVVRVNRAVAVAELSGPTAGLAALAGVRLPGHRLPAVRAELLARTGDTAGARSAYDGAVAVCGNSAEQAHLVERRRALDAAGGP